MTDFKAPSDTLTVGEREIFMSYARLLRIISIFPEGLTGLTTSHADPAILATITQILLSDKGVEPEDYPDVESFELSMAEGEAIGEWGLAHAFGFFARKVESTLKAAKATGEIIQKTTTETEELTNSMLSSNGTAP